MTSPNQHIRDELERFRLLSGPSFYALQINAPWGAGKTYFIQSYLDDVIPEKPDVEAPRSLYITLFGAQSIGDLENQVVGQLFSRSMRLVGTLVRIGFHGFAGFLQMDKAAQSTVDRTQISMIANRLESVRKGLVIFDDIERSGMPLKDALGYINRFVEREGFKVVLISNEEALSRDDASGEEKANAGILRTFKEKLVGRTLHLAADPDAAYPSFVDTMVCDQAKTIASNERSTAIQLFKASGRENLRSLRIGLEAFDRLVPILDPIVLTKEEGLREILLSCLYVAIELGAAGDKAVIADPEGRRVWAAPSRSRGDEPSPRYLQANSIVERYGELLNLRTPAIPLNYVVECIAHGQVFANKINAAVKISPLFADPDDVPPWRKLIEIWDIGIDSYIENVSRAIEQFRRLEVRDPGEILQLAGIMLWCDAKGDLTLSDQIKPTEFIREYLERLHQNESGLYPDLELLSSDRLSRFSSYGYIALSPDDRREEMKEIAQLIRRSMYRSAEARFPEVRSEIFDVLRSPDRDFQNLLSGNRELAAYLEMPIFCGSDPKEFADLLLRNKAFDHRSLKWLAERYRSLDEAALRAEHKWLEGLFEEVKKCTDGAPLPLKALWAETMQARLGPVLERLATSGDGPVSQADDGADGLAPKIMPGAAAPQPE